MAFLCKDADAYLKNDTFYVWDDFDHYVTADLWTTVADNSGTVAVSDAVGGEVAIAATDATGVDNDQTYMVSTMELFKFATGKPLFFAAKVKTYANTIASTNFMVGLCNNVAAETIQDDAAGPPADYHGAIFFSAETAYWQVESSASTTQTTVNTGKAYTNNTYDILVIEALPISSTETECHFYQASVQSDGDYTLEEVGLTTGGRNSTEFVAQTLTHTSVTEMQIVLGVKDAGTNNSARIYADWVYCAQKR